MTCSHIKDTFRPVERKGDDSKANSKSLIS